MPAFIVVLAAYAVGVILGFTAGYLQGRLAPRGGYQPRAGPPTRDSSIVLPPPPRRIVPPKELP